MSVSVRDAVAGDGERIASMVAKLAASEGKPKSGFSAAHFRRDGFGPDARFGCLVAERDGAVVGYASYYPAYDMATPSHGLHLLDLFVEPDARRSGVGTALVREIAERCHRRGGRWISLHVRPRNAGARAFYERLGAQSLGLLFLAIADAALADLMPGGGGAGTLPGTQE
jgi:ribosomal protein S18 acetylase RimI-like enzyme